MNLDQFITKYNNNFVEYHSYSANSKFQCADLANQYIVEVIGLPAIIGTNAQQFPDKAGDKYQYILNTPTGVPKKGDIIIWSSADNIGHIAVFIDGDSNRFNSFDQNYPTGTPCHIQSHTYLRPKVIGWLRAKVQSAQEFMQIEKSVFENLVTKATKWDELDKAGYPNVKAIELVTNSLRENAEDVKREYDKFVLDIVSKLNPTGSLAPVTDKNYALQLIDGLVIEKDEIQKTLKTKEDQFVKTTRELESENLRLETELTKLKQELEEMETKHTSEIEKLKKRLETVSKSTTALKENKALNKNALSLISKLKRLLGIK